MIGNDQFLVKRISGRYKNFKSNLTSKKPRYSRYMDKDQYIKSLEEHIEKLHAMTHSVFVLSTDAPRSVMVNKTGYVGIIYSYSPFFEFARIVSGVTSKYMYELSFIGRVGSVVFDSLEKAEQALRESVCGDPSKVAIQYTDCTIK